jgi:competence protein ComEC
MNGKLIFFSLAFLCVLLAVRIAVFYHSVSDYPPGTVITWQTQLPDQPKLKKGGQQITIYMPNSQRVTVKFGLNPLLSYGDTVNIRGKLRYFRADDGKMIAFMDRPEFELVKKGADSSFIIRLRDQIIVFFNSSLPDTYSSLMLGFVFGIKEEMPAYFYADLQKTGLMHVIAASGMNITMVGGFLVFGFAIFVRRQIAVLLSIIGILFYAVLAGLEPSIVRAAIMGILVLLAQLTGRQSSGFLALFAAGFIMLFRSPSLATDIGFQLSFLATFGLIFLRPVFTMSPRIAKLVEKTVIGEDLATTLTAQLMTLPILLVNFGSYSLWSIPVNAIVLWTVPFLMIIGGFASIIGLIIEPLGRLILYLSVPFLLYFTEIVEFFGNLGGQIKIESLPLLIIAGYYLIILSVILWIRKK